MLKWFFKRRRIRVVGPCVILPPDAPGLKECRLYLGCLSAKGWKRNPDRHWWELWKPKFIREPMTESWVKNDVTPITFTTSPHSEDKLLVNRDSHINYNSPGNNLPANP